MFHLLSIIHCQDLSRELLKKALSHVLMHSTESLLKLSRMMTFPSPY